jgi:hypothetical protein
MSPHDLVSSIKICLRLYQGNQRCCLPLASSPVERCPSPILTKLGIAKKSQTTKNNIRLRERNSIMLESFWMGYQERYPTFGNDLILVVYTETLSHKLADRVCMAESGGHVQYRSPFLPIVRTSFRPCQYNPVAKSIRC